MLGQQELKRLRAKLAAGATWRTRSRRRTARTCPPTGRRVTRRTSIELAEVELGARRHARAPREQHRDDPGAHHRRRREDETEGADSEDDESEDEEGEESEDRFMEMTKALSNTLDFLGIDAPVKSALLNCGDGERAMIIAAIDAFQQTKDLEDLKDTFTRIARRFTAAQ